MQACGFKRLCFFSTGEGDNTTTMACANPTYDCTMITNQYGEKEMETSFTVPGAMIGEGKAEEPFAWGNPIYGKSPAGKQDKEVPRNGTGPLEDEPEDPWHISS